MLSKIWNLSFKVALFALLATAAYNTKADPEAEAVADATAKADPDAYYPWGAPTGFAYSVATHPNSFVYHSQSYHDVDDYTPYLPHHAQHPHLAHYPGAFNRYHAVDNGYYGLHGGLNNGLYNHG